MYFGFTCKWFRTPLNVLGLNPLSGLFERSKFKRFGKQQKAASSMVVIRFPAKFNTTKEKRRKSKLDIVA